MPVRFVAARTHRNSQTHAHTRALGRSKRVHEIWLDKHEVEARRRHSNLVMHMENDLAAKGETDSVPRNKALCCLSPTNRLRVWAFKLIRNRVFTNLVLFLIILNSVFLALTDYAYLEADPESKAFGDFTVVGSLNNKIVEGSDPIFTTAFTIEAAVKIVALGFWSGPDAYLRDPWNGFDFFIVVCGLIKYVPGLPNIGFLRTFRVLRPLKSLAMFPALRQLIDGLLGALPALANVFLLLAFLFSIFGILGVQLWLGIQHGRCRTTPYPILLPPKEGSPAAAAVAAATAAANVAATVAATVAANATAVNGGGGGGSGNISSISSSNNVSSTSAAADPATAVWPSRLDVAWSSFSSDDFVYPVPASYLDAALAHPARYRCVPEDDSDSWTQRASPWRTPQPCFWPTNDDDMRLCNPAGIGNHQCQLAVEWCGSNYDPTGLPRFSNERALTDPTYSEDLNWGITTFDNMGSAALSIFQSITMEGWVDIMYQLQDTYQPTVVAVFFIALILFGSLFVLNLTLAVIWENFELEPIKLDESKEGKQPNPDAVGPNGVALSIVSNPMASKTETDMMNGSGGGGGGGGIIDDMHGGGGGGGGDQRRGGFLPQRHEQEALGKTLASMKSMRDLKALDEAVERREQAGWCSRMFLGCKQAVGLVSLDEDAKLARQMRAEERAKNPTCLDKAQLKVKTFMLHPVITWTVIVLILVNTTVLAMDHHPMDPGLGLQLEIINFILTVAFAIECVLMIFGLGIREYVEDRMRQFDAFIVLVSIVEVIALPPSFISGKTEGSAGGLSALRAFRILRVFRLAKKWKSFAKLLVVIADTLKDITYFSILLGLFMYITALVGSQFLASQMHYDGDTSRHIKFRDPGWVAAPVPRGNFDGLLWAFVSIFQILSGENWNTLMYDGSRATHPAMIIFFVSVVVIGNLILLNLFLAIMLSSFDMVSMEEDAENAEEEAKRREEEEAAKAKEKPTKFKNLLKKHASKIGGIGKVFDLQGGGGGEEGGQEQAPAKKPRKTCAERCQDLGKFCISDRSIFVFGPKNPIRRGATWLVNKPWFDNTILFLIVISSITLAIDNPLNNPNSDMATVLKYIDVVMTTLFTLEMLLKIVVRGFVLRPFPQAYLHEGWNVLDFAIVIVSILGIVPFLTGQEASSDPSLKSLRSLRTMRALRPLRMISRAPGLRLVVTALIDSIPSIINVMVICILFFTIFAIIAISYFKGAFNACQGEAFDALSEDMVDVLTYSGTWGELTALERRWFQVNTTTAAGGSSAAPPPLGGYCPEIFGLDLAASAPGYANLMPTSRQICECWGGEWALVTSQNFDNIFFALSTLVEMSTTEGWVDIMYAAVDSRGIDAQPVVNNSEGWSMFFVAFIIVGSFFFINLFIGLIIENFNRSQQKGTGMIFASEEHAAWVRSQDLMTSIRPMIRMDPPKNRCRRWTYLLTHHDSFEITIMVFILLNTIIMAMTYFGQSDDYSMFLDIANYVFAFIFTIECGLKLTALCHLYFKDPWNVFDFLIVAGTNIGLVVQWSGGGGANVSSITTVVRTFRVGRIFRLVKKAKRLRQLFNTLLLSFPALGNIGGLLFLVFFIFTVMGVQLFALVGLHGDLNEHANFQEFSTAFLTLARAATGENWNGVMY
eukprot:g3925.t1